ncbi:protein NO VEIN domain-containing protein [Streptomyces sp. NPDC056930]|uniref:protein NO VEIN domain-containing protein n=1 Tax=Streptomyces sp. NPDC056930 TaxID=3345967 RepID=UPI00362B5F28
MSAIADSGAVWFPDADLLVRGPDELPDDALRAAGALELSDSEAYAQLSVAWGKVDTTRRERIGAAGELVLVDLLTDASAARVEHVAKASDGYGYDIAVHAQQHSMHIEVKSTVRRSRFTAYLSRNEYETMRRDPAWQLVALRLTPDYEAAAIATVPRPWIAAHVPADCSSYGRWESCRLEVPSEVPVPGIPHLSPVLMANASALLTGSAGWPG